MKTPKLIIATFLVTTSFLSFAEGGASQHSGQASKHSVLAVAHGTASTAKAASAVASVPVMVAGGFSVATGSVLVASGEKLAQIADSDQPLIITEKVITVDPAPNKVVIEQTQTTKTKKTTIEQ
ncbi:hypothetical protein [Glaciecola sp. 1036]|uniref:hypothetical protein n=1 Tax=Alteromonadaceae TaxID=72275 RepID=UPI003D05389C